MTTIAHVNSFILLKYRHHFLAGESNKILYFFSLANEKRLPNLPFVCPPPTPPKLELFTQFAVQFHAIGQYFVFVSVLVLSILVHHV